MENFNDFKKAHYKHNTCVMTEGGVINFNPDSLSEVVGAEKMTYDEYLDVQISSLGKTRSYFELCLFNHVIEFKGQIERINKGNVCFKRIYISGMYPDGTMFDGREDHVWMDRKGFEDLRVGDSVSFFAEVYRYVKTSNGKQIDYSLRNPESIKKIPSYELPTRLLPILCKPLKWYRIEISFWRLKKCQSTKTARRYGQRKKREKKNYENFCHCLMWRT